MTPMPCGGSSLLNVQNPIFSQFHQLAADNIPDVAGLNGERLIAPFDDQVQAANDAFGRKREIHFGAQALHG